MDPVLPEFLEQVELTTTMLLFVSITRLRMGADEELKALCVRADPQSLAEAQVSALPSDPSKASAIEAARIRNAFSRWRGRCWGARWWITDQARCIVGAAALLRGFDICAAALAPAAWPLLTAEAATLAA